MKNKAHFIELMGESLIYEFPTVVSFSLDDKDKKARVGSFAEALGGRYDNPDLSDFVSANTDTFFDNIVKQDYSYRGKTIPKGMKIVKAFKYFEENKSLLSDIQNHASRLIQENCIEGKLCLSVHPVDFLTLSENNSNWRSCHSLDGEYRAGNLSYMMDSSTVICYLKGSDAAAAPNIPFLWNDKKWRVLLFVNDRKNMIFAGKQYPLSSSSGMDFVLNNFIKEGLLGAKLHNWTPWCDDQISSYVDRGQNKISLNDSYIPIAGELVKIQSLIDEPQEPLHYNDLLQSKSYVPQYTFGRSSIYEDFRDYYHTHFRIGHKVPCLYCGRNELSNAGGETMMCYDCDFEHGSSNNDYFGHCESCGCRIDMDDAYYVGDDCLCQNCFEESTTRCSECEEDFYDEDITYDRDSDLYLCKHCLREREGE